MDELRGIMNMIILIALCASQAIASQPAGKPLPAVSTVESAVDMIGSNRHGAAAGEKMKNGEIKSFTFTEGELNEFIRQSLQQTANKKHKKAATIKSAVIHLKEGHILEVNAVASVDAGVVKMLGSGEDSVISRTIKQYLTIDNSVTLECLVTAAKGTAFVKVQKVKIKGISIPDTLLHNALTLIGKKQRPPLDLNKPFRLPDGIQTINILPQKLVLAVQVMS